MVVGERVAGGDESKGETTSLDGTLLKHSRGKEGKKESEEETEERGREKIYHRWHLGE